MAKDVFDTICKMDNINQKYFSVLGRLFLNSKNEEEALDWVRLMNKISNFSVEIVDNLLSSYESNAILNTKTVVSELNKLARKYKRPEILFSVTDIDMDLPF